MAIICQSIWLVWNRGKRFYRTPLTKIFVIEASSPDELYYNVTASNQLDQIKQLI